MKLWAWRCYSAVMRAAQKYGIVFLLLQCIGTLTWWGCLWWSPTIRSLFVVHEAPDAVLMAFVAGDILLVSLTAFIAAIGFAHRRPWGWPVLCVTAGAGVYASIYGWMLFILTGSSLVGAVLMTPMLILLPFFVWRLRPERRS